MGILSSDGSKEGVKPSIKIFVIILTVITVAAFGAFFIKLFLKLASPEKDWTRQYESAGDRLKAQGLSTQAIEMYEKFLDQPKVDSQTRARVSQNIGEIHSRDGDCAKALGWLYLAELAGPHPDKEKGLKEQIHFCEKKVRSNPSLK